MNKTNRCTKFQFYLYYDSTCFGQPFCPSSGVLSLTSALVHSMQYMMNRLLPGVGWNCSSILLLVPNGHNYIKSSKAVVWLRAPDDGQKGCPETCRLVILIKLEFSASVGFINKESVTIHGHTIAKNKAPTCFRTITFIRERII